VVSFPIAWDDQWEVADFASEGSPYSNAEIAKYLQSCREMHQPAERDFRVREITLTKTRALTTRCFWLWEVTDDERVQWFVIVGSGEGPFSDRRPSRWIYAQTNDEQESAEKFLDRAIAEHP
jgi:hypothetical protein